MRECEKCHGEGCLEVDAGEPGAVYQVLVSCDRCKGTGREPEPLAPEATR